MSQAYILLATKPNAAMLALGEDGSPPATPYGELNPAIPEVAAVLTWFRPLSVPNDTRDGTVQVKEPNDVDGGNGSGGDGMNSVPIAMRYAFSRRTFWNFRTCPASTELPDVRFPPLLRFEVCLHFSSLNDVAEFMDEAVDVPRAEADDKDPPQKARKELLAAVFEYVELVAVSELA